ncbi:MAG: hypothetical protein FWF38_02005 [Spirochaetaceae bacterium]|nr:hypothetical protein [Spirochaetaceae bacterium]
MERKLDKSKVPLLQKIFFIAIYAFAGTIAVTHAYSHNYSFPETYEIRREFTHLMTAPNRETDNQKPMITECFLTGKKVKFQVVYDSGFYYFIFINETGSLSQKNEFPMVSAGTYIIRKDARSGAFNQIKIFLNNDPDTFVRISSYNEGSMLEFSLFKSMVYKEILIPISINKLITEPFETIIKLSDYIINWDMLYAFYNETENKFVMNICQEIDKKLPTLNDSDDGAQEWNGDFVFIGNSKENPGKGFNCSGFAKWVADGIFSAKTNRLMDISVLKKKNIFDRRDTLSLIYEDERDPLFGLDWTRNIAMTIYELDNPEREIRISDVDVRDYPYEKYSEDIGYSIANLKAILYYLTVTNPGYIYLGSVNGDFGKDPILRQHYHVVVFLPYIGPGGNFYPVVYERNIKRPIDDFIKKYPRESIHLVRIKVDKNFSLSVIPPSFE